MSKLYSAENVGGIEVTSDPLGLGSRLFVDKARQVLSAENLILLCGLGTSLCVKSGAGRAAPTMADLWSEAQAAGGGGFEDLTQKVRYVTPAGRPDDVELLLSQCQLSERFDPSPTVSDFIAALEARIVARCGFVNETTELPHHELLLRKVARRSVRIPRMKLFTPNYDLSFEMAATRGGFIIVDGFSHTQPQEFDGGYFAYDIVRRERGRDIPEFVANVFHLYKLHGSLDWERLGRRIVRAVKPEHPLIIYPRDSKYQSSYDQPYLELMSRFHVALREPNTALLIIGFGFNDQHIAEPLLAAVRSNVSLRILCVDPAIVDMVNRAKELRDLLAAGDMRITLLASTFEEFVTLLPDIVTISEQEMHERRVRDSGAPA